MHLAMIAARTQYRQSRVALTMASKSAILRLFAAAVFCALLAFKLLAEAALLEVSFMGVLLQSYFSHINHE